MICHLLRKCGKGKQSQGREKKTQKEKMHCYGKKKHAVNIIRQDDSVSECSEKREMTLQYVKSVEEDRKHSEIKLDVKINRKTITMELDTGAAVSLMSATTQKKADAKCET